jgi:hypothetical protein
MLSHHQAAMLRMFERGWAFRLYNKRPTSWLTYWALVRKNLICDRDNLALHGGRPVVYVKLTEKGKKELERYNRKEEKSNG